MRVYSKIMQGINEAIAYEKGEGKANVRKMSIAPIKKFGADEVKVIRIRTGLSQVVFAKVLGVSNKTVEAWESGKNSPSGPAVRMLCMMQKDPELPRRENIIEM